MISACGYSKAKLRLAIAPFVEEFEVDVLQMPLELAQKIVEACDGQ